MDLARVSTMSELEENDLPFKRATRPWTYWVMSGSIRLTCNPGDLPYIVVGYANGGDVLGEMAVIDPALGVPRRVRRKRLSFCMFLPMHSTIFAQGHPVAGLAGRYPNEMTQRIRVLNERGALFLIDAEMEVRKGKHGSAAS